MSELTYEQAQTRAKELLDPHHKPAWIPITEQGDPATKSKYYGSPWLAQSETWPTILGKPARFVLQLEVSSLPEPVKNLLGGKGLVQFFFQTDTETCGHDEDTMSLVRLVHPDETPGSAVPQPDEQIQDPGARWYPRLPLHIVGWTEASDFPDLSDHDALGINDELEILECKVGSSVIVENECLQGDKICGWPSWTQDNDTPLDVNDEGMIAFYQLGDSSFFEAGEGHPCHAPDLFAADGTGHLFVSPSNPHEMRFVFNYT